MDNQNEQQNPTESAPLGNQENLTQNIPQQPIPPQPQPINSIQTQDPNFQGYPNQDIPQQPIPVTTKMRRVPLWLKIVLSIVGFIVILILIIVITVNLTTSSAVPVSNQFIQDVQNNHPNAAYQLTAPAFQQSESQTQFAQLVNQRATILPGKLNMLGKSIYSGTGQSTFSVIDYSDQTQQGKLYFKVILQHNKTWQIYNFQIMTTQPNTSLN